MQIVKHTASRKVSIASTATVWEYDSADKKISGAVAEIHGRYPQAGFAQNGFKELVFVLSGNGFIISPTERKEIDVGDEIFIDNNEQYAWEAKSMTLFMATTPKFDPKKHKII